MPDSPNLSEAKRALLEKMLRGNLSQAKKDAGAIPRRSQNGPVPLSFNQQRFWLSSRLNPDMPAHNEGMNIYLPGPLDVAILEQSLNEIIRRHEAWRTSFPLVGGEPIQFIHPSYTLPLPVVDLHQLPPAERESEALRLGVELVEQLFDLAKAPPIRALLVRLRKEEHRLFIAVHHMIFDGFSAYQVILPELSALYQAFLAGQPSPLPELSIQYADYALWQHETLQGDVLENHLSHWKKRLAGAPNEVAIPTDHLHSSSTRVQKGVYPFHLPAQLSKALEALGRQEGASLFMTLLAGFGVFLYRYSGQEDIVIGIPSSGRALHEVQRLLGVFINTLPLRLGLSGNPSFREMLKRAREEMLEELDHEDLPFEHIVRHLQPERVSGQNPLFQILLNVQPPVTALPSGWSVSQMISHNRPAGFDLMLELEESAEGMSGSFGYKIDLFEPDTIQRMAGHLLTLLHAIVANPGQSIGSLPLMTRTEQRQILVDWNAAQTPYPQDTCVHRLFEEQAERTPDAIAVVYEDTQLTYQELNEHANQLAHHLRALGVGPETLVGLCLERSVDLLVGLLGIHKAGGAYMPLDPTYPKERLAYMIGDSQAAVLVTQQHLRANLPISDITVVCLDADQPRLAQQPGSNLSPTATPDNLAYVIYTSGSTGKPKGVQVLQRALVNFLLSMQHQPGLTASDRLLAVTTLSFDIAALELFLPLLVGAQVIIVSRETAANGAELALALKRSQATVMQATPVTWRLLLAAGWQGTPTLKILCGGEALPFDLAYQLLQRCGALWNVYGPTETTIWSTARQLTSDDTVISIGHPIANTQVYVLNAFLQPVPIGVSGELYIGGDGLARGYLHRPDLTAERFIRHPFSMEPGARVYRTGDLARFLPNGELEHLGRVDHQVKIRGFRIELGEIEAVLSQHPTVREAAVVAREDTPGEKRLVAYIVPQPSAQVSTSVLREALATHLPAYMIPAVFVILETMPLTPNNKVDRRALPAPTEIQTQRSNDQVAPRTPTEEQLAAIWANLLGLNQVGITENFFELGGHSLLAVQMLTRVQERLQVELPFAALFESPTIAGLALKIVQRQADQVDDATLAQLLAELEELPDTDVQDMLATEKRAENGRG